MRSITMSVLCIAFAFMAFAQQAPTSAPQSVVPKETSESLKLQLSLEKIKSIQLQAQIVQNTIEPQMAPLRKQYADEDQVAVKAIEEVKKQNGWGNEVTLDRNPQSTTYGQFLKAVPPPISEKAPPVVKAPAATAPAK